MAAYAVGEPAAIDEAPPLPYDVSGCHRADCRNRVAASVDVMCHVSVEHAGLDLMTCAWKDVGPAGYGWKLPAARA